MVIGCRGGGGGQWAIGRERGGWGWVGVEVAVVGVTTAAFSSAC